MASVAVRIGNFFITGIFSISAVYDINKKMDKGKGYYGEMVCIYDSGVPGFASCGLLSRKR